MILINGYTIDASVRRAHELNSTTTDRPIEDGSVISDHRVKQPRLYTMEGIVSNTPLGAVEAIRTAAGLAVGVDVPNNDGLPPVDDALAFLEDLFESGERVRIVTKEKTLDNMVLLSLRTPKDRDTGDALRFFGTWKQIQTVTNIRAFVPVTVRRAVRKRKLGTRPAAVPSEQDPPRPEPPKELRSRLYDGESLFKLPL